MGTIVGGIGVSHAPSLARAYDQGLGDDPEWRDVFAMFEPAATWMRELAPDALVVVYNDHVNQFFFDAYPTFALGVADDYPQADEGWGLRPLPDLAGDSALAWHIARSIVAEEFDPTICQEMAVDHGLYSVLPFLAEPPWSIPIVPLAVNVIRHPLPTPRRCHRLGQAIRRAVDSFEPDTRVLVIATGGMSHQLHGSDFGMLAPEWDNEFLDLLEADPDALCEIDHLEYMRRGGAESVEIIMWLAMRGALGDQVRRAHRAYAAPMLTGYGLICLEPT
ncbi:MAG: class III extradiol dioxygenase family protein [Actinomycetota bacterium]|jgi:protocatechuate 4,5-dioxygenase, beta chain|nr:class III extradiol dioxygenase family protein [Actinomycetota bacterium]